MLTRCSQSAAEFGLLIKLNQDEYKEYHALGTVYAEYLAARVNYWSHEYWPRNVAEKQEAVDKAISTWRNSQA